MKKSALLGKLEYFTMVHGVTVRAIETFSDEAARDGQITGDAAERSKPETEAGKRVIAGVKTAAALSAFAEQCHRAAEAIWRAMPEEHVVRAVASPFGDLPAWKFFEFGYDEHWHHRGQLYTYLRLLGKEPPRLYDY